MAKQGYLDQSYWVRIIFMLVFWAVLNLAITVFGLLVLLVGVVRFASAHKPTTLSTWLLSVGAFLQQIFAFLSFKTDEKPFPFQPWPKVDSDEEG
ncbi:DUF4389 domain-containing protein [Marinomonas epiphytica]